VVKRKVGKKSTPYESAFEDYLRRNEVLYVATSEVRRPITEGKAVKNFDFIVISFKGKYLIDIKGRRFVDAPWENWIHHSDIESLKAWAMYFQELIPLLVYPYVIDDRTKNKFDDVFSYKGITFGVVGIKFEDYYRNMKRRGKVKKAGIGGVYVSKSLFPKLVQPISYFIPELKPIPTGKI